MTTTPFRRYPTAHDADRGAADADVGARDGAHGLDGLVDVPRFRLRRLAYEPPLPQGEPARASAAAVPITADLPGDLRVQVEMERWMRLLVEVLADRRPVQQLAVVATRPVLRYLRATVHRLAHARPIDCPVGAGWRAPALSVRVCQPHERVAEVAAVCLLGGRVRAVAARFERRGSGVWFCTAVRVG